MKGSAGIAPRILKEVAVQFEMDLSRLPMGLCSEWPDLPWLRQGVQAPSTRQLQDLHTPQSIDQEHARLPKDME